MDGWKELKMRLHAFYVQPSIVVAENMTVMLQSSGTQITAPENPSQTK